MAVPVSVRVLPAQSVVADGVAVTVVGLVLTFTVAVVAIVLPQLLVAVSVYMPAEAVLTVKPAGLRSVDVNDDGPLHAYEVAPVATPVSVSVLPEQSVRAEGAALTVVGAVFTATAEVVTVVEPHALVATSV